jgi:plasmid stabilization system protein ParE
MSRTPQIVERARADVDNIFNWLVNRSVQGAISWYLAFYRAVDRIGSAPESHAKAAESHQLGRPLKQALFKTRRGRTYRIVFEVHADGVIILRVRGPGQAPLRNRDVASEK